jgi:crotonobetainyl-CoA:carnitine CoA-transferase CaiB-like acyl-CoA transferase
VSETANDEEQSGPLSALTLLDLTEGVAGPFAARLFADQGARVIKVERRAGVAARSRPEFAALNAGKLSLTLDYHSAAGAAVLAGLIREADAIIEDAPSRRRADLGLDAETLLGRTTRLVITSLLLPPGTATPQVGLYAYFATLAALWSAGQTEHGQAVEVDGLACLASDCGPLLTRRLAGEAVSEAAAAPRRESRTGASSALSPFVLPDTATRGEAPRLGEHTEALLSELLGLEAPEIEALRREGVI